MTQEHELFLQRVGAKLWLWKSTPLQQVVCDVIGVHIWIRAGSSSEQFPHEDAIWPLGERKHRILCMPEGFYEKMLTREVICVNPPHQTWRWTFVFADFRWPSTWRAASPVCGLECCSILCHRCPWPCQNPPPLLCTFHPTWKHENTNTGSSSNSFWWFLMGPNSGETVKTSGN